MLAVAILITRNLKSLAADLLQMGATQLDAAVAVRTLQEICYES